KLSATKSITTPALKRTADPGGDDIAVIELAELGPLHLAGFNIYTQANEDGKLATQVGYGHTGTGTSGLLNGDSGVLELKRLRFQGTPTGGTYKLWLADSPNNKVTIAHWADADFIETAIELLPNINDVEVTKVHTAPGHPYNGSFEIVFKDTDYADGNVPNMVCQDNVSGSAVSLQNLFDGGSPRKKRMIQNVISFAGNVDGVQRLRFDFDNGTAAANYYNDGLGLGASEGMGAPSDSGSPVFIAGKIASLHKGPVGDGLDGIADTRDFGEASSSVRVSTHQDFIEDNLDGPYDLVLNMNTQIWGNNGIGDTIQVKRSGANIQIWIGGILRYQDAAAKIESVKVIGSDDSETITVDKLGAGIPVEVEAGGGNDTVRVAGVSSASSLRVEAGSGNDTIVVGHGQQKLASQIINADLDLFGNSGDDIIKFLDGNATDTSPDYTLDHTTFDRTFLEPVTYNAERVELYARLAGAGGNNVRVEESVADTVEIFGGSVNDYLTVGDGDLFGFDEKIILHGGGGYNTLSVDDSDAVADRTWRADGNKVFRPGLSGEVKYYNMDQLLLTPGAGDDTIQIWGTPSGTGMYATGNGGADSFQIGHGDLDTIGGALNIQGGTGADTAVLDDTDDVAFGQYTLTSTGVSKFGFSFGTLGVEDLTLKVHGTGSTVSIDGTPAIMTRVNGGAGNDQFLLSPTAKNLFQLGGGLVLDGKGGNDHVRLYDQNSAVPAAEFTVTGNAVTRNNFGDLSYTGMENLTLNLGNGANNVRLHGTSAGTAVNIYGNGGNDTFDVTDAPKSPVLLNGGAGFDVLEWNTGVAAGDANSGFAFITKVSIEQTQFPIQI
ncbi:MAG TPA: hypothetical protein VKD90_01620, partial [Gemmataceae bacterium]|nr:hypothetical protein [Gemmataceae bacterium]